VSDDERSHPVDGGRLGGTPASVAASEQINPDRVELIPADGHVEWIGDLDCYRIAPGSK
jgi:hypothetical protein